MNDNEVNETIAEFMGCQFSIDHIAHYPSLDEGVIVHDLFTKSLDALVPVWEKISFIPFFDRSGMTGKWYCVHVDFLDNGNFDLEYRRSIQQAAAHATAKAIMELQSKGDE